MKLMKLIIVFTFFSLNQMYGQNVISRPTPPTLVTDVRSEEHTSELQSH